MTIDIAGFVAEVTRLSATGKTTEHSYRGALEKLFNSLAEDVNCINEPEAIRNVGRPDFVLLRDNGQKAQITVGHVEAKDIDLDIRPKAMRDANRNQWERYTKALPNLIYTNGLDFAFYKKGELVREISIGEWMMGVQAKPENYEALANQLRDFAAERLQTITSAEVLAEMMAGKAVLIKDVLFKTLRMDEDLTSELAGQYKAFKNQLIHDLGIEEFADIYAETIAYGMFAARLHDETLETFSRAEALNLLPKSNPFLRRLFEFVAGPNLPEGVRSTVDELAEVFQATDLQILFENFGSFTQRNDPFIHFYETFLAKYNPAKRKARGVWYTPEPVVNFIVRAVDDVLKEEFGLADGLADTSKIDVTYEEPNPDKPGKWRKKTETMHRVQILDPAAGTGTFLAEVIKQISDKIKAVAPGQLPAYIENDLIPRLHGFELLMASYAMCHMKLDMMLTSLGYKPTQEPPRLGVYLTNSLEEGAREVPDLLMTRWLSEEARLANDVKRDKPIMCVIGNPPYSGESANKGDWIMNLMEAYKKEPGGKEKLKERNPKWINDDYVKFIRFAEHMIEKNGEGVLAFITNHGYLDNPTFRGMRWHLLKTFDKIYVLDLHGNAKKKEVAPDGSPDKNVFDIQQGVALIIAVKRKEKSKELAQIFHGDLWGDRKEKYKALEDGIKSLISKSQLPNQAPQYPFVERNFELEATYNEGFGVQQLMPINSVGIVTARDSLTIDMDRDALWKRVEDFTKIDIEDLRNKYALGKDVQDWSVPNAKTDVVANYSQDNLAPIAYRPFDNRWTFYTGTSRGFQCRPRDDVMQHFLNNQSLGFCISKQQKASTGFFHILAQNKISESCLTSNKTAEIGTSFPLYLYPDEQDLDQSIRVNMDANIRAQIEAAAMGKRKPHPEVRPQAAQATQHEGEIDITPSKDAEGRPNEVAIFDYIYGVLHSPDYRETYKEFLKIDFPRIPYPPSPEVFWHVSEKGTQLRHLHLMEEEAIGKTPYLFEGEGDSKVDKVKYEGTSVFINETQYFCDVPQIAWEFYIGGYQPAQKWLKDRKGRTLSFDDIRHYQKIIKILCETDRIMKEIRLPLE